MYVELLTDYEPKVVGVRDGVGQVEWSAAFDAQHSWYVDLFGPQEEDFFTTQAWRKWATMPDHGQPLQGLALRKAAKLTDLVGAGLLRGYLVSERLRQLLETFHLPRHRYFEATFARQNQLLGGYWWLVYDLDDGHQTVDFAQSTFDFTWHERKFGQAYQVHSYEEYLALSATTKRAPQAKTLVFNQRFDNTLDLWGTQFLALCQGYCSPALAQALHQQRLTGYRVRSPRCALRFA
jgi:hypothetical protein